MTFSIIAPHPPTERESCMSTRPARIFRLTTAFLGLMAGAGSQAAQGLSAPEADQVWPQWQARVSLQSAPLSRSDWASTASQISLASSEQSQIRGGAIVGDYYFAQPFFGRFRASGGVMMGAAGGSALGGLVTSAGNLTPGLGLSVQGRGLAAPSLTTESADPIPYLGLGYSGSLWRDRIALSADLGLVSERPGGAGQVGRALFGNQGMNQALREMRLSPVFQLGVRYAF